MCCSPWGHKSWTWLSDRTELDTVFSQFSIPPQVVSLSLYVYVRDFPGGAVFKNPPTNAGDRFDPRSGKIPLPAGQPSLHATTAEARAPQSPCCVTREANAMRSPKLQLERSPLFLLLEKPSHSSKDPESSLKKKKVYVGRWKEHQPGPRVCLPWGEPATPSRCGFLSSPPPPPSIPKFSIKTSLPNILSSEHPATSQSWLPCGAKTPCWVQTCQATGPGDGRREPLTSLVRHLVSPLEFTSTWTPRNVTWFGNRHLANIIKDEVLLS